MTILRPAAERFLPPSVRVPLCIAIMLTALLSQAAAQETFRGEFWSELEPFIRDDGIYPLSREDAAREILEEARSVYSGMIYGYSFVYTPLDKARNVGEVFDLVALAELPWGDKGFSITQSRIEGKKLYASTAYRASAFQLPWITGWKSNVLPRAGGSADVSILEGKTGKLKAVRDAVKQAIREYLRQVEYNKPREISGEVVLSEVPRIVITSGSYSARVNIRLRVKEIVSYRVY